MSGSRPRIRIVAPSGAFDREAFEAGIAIIHDAGFDTVFDQRIFQRVRYLAGDDDNRLAGVFDALADRSVAAIWTARGGYGATRIVDRITPPSDAPCLVGFSDTTALHAAWTRHGLCSIHAANVTTLKDWSPAALEELFSLIPAVRPQRFECQVRRSGAARGTLVGGNLTVLAAMCGTAELPNFKRAIVLLEDVGEAAYRLDRALSQLIRAGALAEASGFVVGQLTRCGEGALEVVLERLEPLEKPVIFDAPLGHDSTSRAVTLGTIARIDGATLWVGSRERSAV